MREALLAVVLLAAGLAGCIGEDTETDPAGERDQAPVPEELAFADCREILGVWRLAYEDVASYLPPGFEPTTLGEEDTTGQNASLHHLALSCSQPRDATVLFPWLPVIPPDHFAAPEADVYRVMLPCIGDAAIVGTLQAWGAPCMAGEAGITTETDTPAAATWALDADSPDLTIRLEGTGAATSRMSDEPLFRQFHVTERTVCSVTHLQLEDHIHWRGSDFTIESEGEAPFPVPEEPGRGLLAQPSFEMKVTPVSIEGQAPADEGACPGGQVPSGSSGGEG